MGRSMREAAGRLAEVRDLIADARALEAVDQVIAEAVKERMSLADQKQMLADVIATALRGRRLSMSHPKLSEAEVIRQAIDGSGLF